MVKTMNKSNLDYFEKILSIIPGHIYWKDKKGVFLGCNDEQAKTFNLLDVHDVIGKTDYDFYERDKAEAIFKADQQVISSGQVIILEEPVTLLNGKTAVFLSKKVPLRNKPGEIIGIVGVSFDITERKVMEEELKAAKERIDSMRLVSASIAHELRTPLHSIKLFASALQTYLPDLLETYRIAKNAGLEIPLIRDSHVDMLRKNVDGINLQIDHASLVIDMLLTNLSFNKVHKNKLQMHSIATCVESALETYPFRDEERKLIHWSNDKDFQFLGVDTLITQVLFNLFKNALYAIASARRGEIRLWVEYGVEYNKFYVEDTARGIEKDIIDHIFDQFFTKDTAHGTGIGLAFCKMCMKEHGGDIECESEYGKYARFTLMFPKVERKDGL
jgi:signal transduction histidine kinase